MKKAQDSGSCSSPQCKSARGSVKSVQRCPDMSRSQVRLAERSTPTSASSWLGLNFVQKYSMSTCVPGSSFGHESNYRYPLATFTASEPRWPPSPDVSDATRPASCVLQNMGLFHFVLGLKTAQAMEGCTELKPAPLEAAPKLRRSCAKAAPKLRPLRSPQAWPAAE